MSKLWSLADGRWPPIRAAMGSRGAPRHGRVDFDVPTRPFIYDAAVIQEAKPLPPILIVDDDTLITESLAFVLGNEFRVWTATSREQAIRRLRDMPPPRVALVDLGLPPLPHRPDEGFALIGAILAHSPETRIIVLSGQSDNSNARHARALGATEFIAKPADPDALRDAILRIIAFSDEVQIADDGLIGRSAPMMQLKSQLRKFADSPYSVLVEGESGSGKELVAKALHSLSERGRQPYLTLNCAAIAPSLVEAALFGHGKGAFTGAVGARAGYFQDAGAGTLFLDEIGELPLELQPKLLRVLENGEYQRLGETETRIAHARIVTATNRDLRQEVRSGRFRADLYHRLSVFTLHVPPLRHLGNDRFVLLDHFLRQYSAQTGTAAPVLSAEASQSFSEYAFPGNVRELRNVAIRLTAKFPGATLSAEDMQAEFDIEPQAEASEAAVRAFPSSPVAEILPQEGREYAPSLSGAMRDLLHGEGFNLDARLREIERNYVEAAQQLANGNISQAARLLGINRTTLYNRLESLGRDRDTGSDRNRAPTG